ncbi:MAG TPA: biotin-dependent carboxyltransferase family protein [Verrucomicrobiae bacterium]|jgi:biotin-dependent carboxylase-like uncharacterized protein
MRAEFLEVLDPGFGLTVQDTGRRGWRRFGVPPSGAMDDHAASWANRLVDNPANAPVLELLLQGAKLRLLADAWLAITGADADCNLPTWRAVHVAANQTLNFPHTRSGVWIYVAVNGDLDAPRWLGSASVYPRGQLGRALTRGDVLGANAMSKPFELPPGVAGRTADWHERRNYDHPPPLRVWRGPQWELFNHADRERFFATEWTVTPQSDRVGYRLSGAPLAPTKTQILSEPVLVGSIQIPDNGQPIVTMRDGPTVGGYPKLGVIDAADISWLAQCRPGTKVRFQLFT